MKRTRKSDRIFIRMYEMVSMADSDVTNKNPQTSWPAGFLIQMIRGHLFLLTCGDILNLVDDLLILALGLEMDAESDDDSDDAANTAVVSRTRFLTHE